MLCKLSILEAPHALTTFKRRCCLPLTPILAVLRIHSLTVLDTRTMSPRSAKLWLKIDAFSWPRGFHARPIDMECVRVRLGKPRAASPGLLWLYAHDVSQLGRPGNVRRSARTQCRSTLARRPPVGLWRPACPFLRSIQS